MLARSAAARAVDVVEAVYDLEPVTESWFRNVVEVMAKTVDADLGVVGTRMTGVSPEGVPLLSLAHVHGADETLPTKFLSASQDLGQERTTEAIGTFLGKTFAVTEVQENFPDVTRAYQEHIGCQDVLIMSALDPSIFGVSLNFVSSKGFDLTPSHRDLLAKLSIHITAGDRLRRGLNPDESVVRGFGLMDIHDRQTVDAILDPTRFAVTHTAGDAQDSEAQERIREAARAVDRARGALRKSDPEKALGIWQGLVRGRWSLVDWFDSDGRRFMLARSNAPDLGDPRGLTPRELQVATYAASGESQKLIGYRFGLTPGHVSALLKSAMHKLGVKTQPELVAKMRMMG